MSAEDPHYDSHWTAVNGIGRRTFSTITCTAIQNTVTMPVALATVFHWDVPFNGALNAEVEAFLARLIN